MPYRARVEVRLKPGHSDPEGETTARSLRELAYPVETVAVSKTYTIIIKAESKDNAESITEEICRRLLANPTKDDYEFQVEQAE